MRPGCPSWPAGSGTARGGEGGDGEEPSESTGAAPAAKTLPCPARNPSHGLVLPTLSHFLWRANIRTTRRVDALGFPRRRR